MPSDADLHFRHVSKSAPRHRYGATRLTRRIYVPAVGLSEVRQGAKQQVVD